MKLDATVKHEGNPVANPSTEHSPAACGEKCDETANCNSFAFCREAEHAVNCYMKDKPLTVHDEINIEEAYDKHSKCASYKKIGKYFRDEFLLSCLIYPERCFKC